MSDLERCINQAFRPKSHYAFLQRDGVGNCTVCSYDPANNPTCKAYYPIKITTITVEGGKDYVAVQETTRRNTD